MCLYVREDTDNFYAPQKEQKSGLEGSSMERWKILSIKSLNKKSNSKLIFAMNGQLKIQVNESLKMYKGHKSFTVSH